jgi:hypothetical protein
MNREQFIIEDMPSVTLNDMFIGLAFGVVSIGLNTTFTKAGAVLSTLSVRPVPFRESVPFEQFTFQGIMPSGSVPFEYIVVADEFVPLLYDAPPLSERLQTTVPPSPPV